MNRRRLLYAILVVGPIWMVLVDQAVGDAKVRPPGMPGFWYPNDRAALAKQVDKFLATASAASVEGKPIALISPHAGYSIAGPTMAAGYHCLQGHEYKRVIVLGFSHPLSHSYRGVEVTAELTAYATPLGNAPIDRAVCDELLKHRLFISKPSVDRGEHSVENMLPFLQQVLKDFRFVPLLVGQMSERDYTEAAEALLPFIDQDTLLVASSDFTHYGAGYGYKPFSDDVPHKLRELADQAAAPILKADFDGFRNHLSKTGDSICGRGPISLLLRILSMQGGAEGVLAAVDTSGRLTGDWSHSVTYQSIVLTRRPGILNQQERAELAKLARQTVTAQLKGQDLPRPDPEKLPAALKAERACFVTLENKGRLRGCIGNTQPAGPLYAAVIRNAVNACQDRRFLTNPVTAKELDELDIELSCFVPNSTKRVTNPEEVIIGRHGLIIAMGDRAGLLLPQVAWRYGWTRYEFLAQTCHKAGLPVDAWKRPEAGIHSFEAEVFDEPEK
jgi:AmmeMemoRadiSam system protein B/AmmeMemoRadiSam system protein A